MRANHEVELFVHRAGAGPKIVRVAPEATLADVLSAAGIHPQPELLVFVGEPTEAPDVTTEEVIGEDAHEPMPLDQRVAGLDRQQHIHCHRCRRITTTVSYHTRTVHHKFPPSTTIAAATAWARRKLGLTDPGNDRLVLQECDSGEQPGKTARLGELVPEGKCDLCFKLVPDVKFEG